MNGAWYRAFKYDKYVNEVTVYFILFQSNINAEKVTEHGDHPNQYC
jgi:hypothetical protein